jgi:hypothetical protein
MQYSPRGYISAELWRRAQARRSRKATKRLRLRKSNSVTPLPWLPASSLTSVGVTEVTKPKWPLEPSTRGAVTPLVPRIGSAALHRREPLPPGLSRGRLAGATGAARSPAPPATTSVAMPIRVLGRQSSSPPCSCCLSRPSRKPTMPGRRPSSDRRHRRVQPRRSPRAALPAARSKMEPTSMAVAGGDRIRRG